MNRKLEEQKKLGDFEEIQHQNKIDQSWIKQGYQIIDKKKEYCVALEAQQVKVEADLKQLQASFEKNPALKQI